MSRLTIVDQCERRRKYSRAPGAVACNRFEYAKLEGVKREGLYHWKIVLARRGAIINVAQVS